MLCFSHDWSSDPLSKTHLMRIFARNNRVLWVNSIGYRSPTMSKGDIQRIFQKLKGLASPLVEAEPNLFVLNPLFIPIHNRPSIQRLNRYLLRQQVKAAMHRLGFKKPINWIFNPAASVIGGQLGEDKLIYYCVDEYTAISNVDAGSLAEMERGLIQRADLVIVSADRLFSSKKKLKRETVMIRHGVDFEHFRAALAPETPVPEETRDLTHPVLGYFGLIAADWFDLDLMVFTAQRLPNVTIVLLGKCTMDISPLTRLPNVRYLGRKPYASLPAYCKGFDAAVIPFPINELTLNANPLKAREYLAAGLPVVSTRIPEVEYLGLCRIGTDRESFVREIEAALVDRSSHGARSDRMRSESWEARVEEIGRYVMKL